MNFIAKLIRDCPIWLIFSTMAFLILVFSLFELQISSGTFSSTPVSPVFFEGIFISIVLFGLAFIAFAVSNFSGNFLFSNTAFRGQKNSVLLGKVNVKIVFGEIQNIGSAEITILPANEFFDDECICDTRSSLGAYIQSEAPGRTEVIKAVITAYLQDKARDSARRVLNHRGEDALAYEIGTVVPVTGVDGFTRRVALVSTTTYRADEGLVSREEYIFSAIRGVSSYCGKNRINSIVIPLIGSGHGQLTPRVSLISMLQAIKSISAASFIADVTIVVFKKKSEKAQIPERKVYRLIEFTSWLQQRPLPT